MNVQYAPIPFLLSSTRTLLPCRCDAPAVHNQRPLIARWAMQGDIRLCSRLLMFEDLSREGPSSMLASLPTPGVLLLELHSTNG